VGDGLGFRNDGLPGAGEFRLSGRPAIKKGKAKLRLQRVDRVADGGGGPPKTPRGAGEAALFDDRQQHQKLVHAGGSRCLHFNFPEKHFQFYTTFMD
jgi:hypothetical protein